MIKLDWWTNLKCISGSKRIATAANIIECTGSESLDHNDSVTVVVPWKEWWLQILTLRHVGRLTDHAGRVREWRVKSIDDSRQRGKEPKITITLDPIVLDLATMGIVDTPMGGGRPWYNLGSSLATPEQIIRSALLTWFTARGITWIGYGTVEFTDRYNIALDLANPLQWMQELANRSGGEFDLRRNGDTNYLLDLLIGRNLDKPVQELRTSRQVLKLSRSRRVDTLRTAILATGKVPSDDVERATIAYTALKVTAISSNDHTVEYADPIGGDPILCDDQLNTPRPDLAGSNNCYVLCPDASLKQITDTVAATQVLTIPSSGLAVNDVIEVRKNSSGDLLTELTNPAAIQKYGYVLGPAEDSEARGERNHIKNPFYNSFGSAWPVAFCNFDGAHSSTTTVNLKNVPSGFVIPNNAFLWRNGDSRKITTGATESGGLASVTVSGAITASDNEVVYVFGFTPPVDTSAPPESVAHQIAVLSRADTSVAALAPDNCNANGAQTSTRTLAIKNLEANQKITPGMTVKAGSTVIPILEATQANGSGNVTVKLQGAITVSDNDALELRSVDFSKAATLGPNALWLMCAGEGLGDPVILQSNSYTLRYTAGMPKVWISCGFLLWNRKASTATYGATGLIKPCKLRAINPNDSSQYLQVSDATDAEGAEVQRTLAAWGTEYVVLSGSFALTANSPLVLHFLPPVDNSLGSLGTSDAYLLWWMVHIGYDREAPVVEGSHANRIHRVGQRRLDVASADPFTLTAEVADIAQVNPRFAEQVLSMGQRMRVIANDMAGGSKLDVQARLTSISPDYRNPLKTRLTLETVEPRFTKALAAAKARRLYLQLNVADDLSETLGTDTVRTAPATETLPVEIPDAARIVISPGEVGSDPGTGVIPFEPYRRSTAQ